MEDLPIQGIPDIHIGRVYDQRDPECEIHYETFSRLADFFGRNTPPHRHYCFYQVHFLLSGSIHLNLDGRVYGGNAPFLIFTPPTLPHSFYSADGTDGHVLTIRQELVRVWFKQMPGQWPDSLLRDPVFFELDTASESHGQGVAQMAETIGQLQREFFGDGCGRLAALRALGELFFIQMGRLLLTRATVPARHQERSEDQRLFLNFCDLVEGHFRDHLTLTEYAGRLSITEARLNDICRRMVNQPSKEVVHDRLLQEARRLLRFTGAPVTEISYHLGFSDPAYFTRFFTKRSGLSPSQFRLQRPK